MCLRPHLKTNGSCMEKEKRNGLLNTIEFLYFTKNMKRENEEFDDSHLRISTVGVLHDIVYKKQDKIGYRNIDGEWILYDPMKKDHGTIIKPDRIGEKAGTKMRDLQAYKPRKKEE